MRQFVCDSGAVSSSVSNGMRPDEQNRTLSPRGQCFMRAHCRLNPRLLDGRRQTDRLAMGAVHRIDEQRHAVRDDLRQLGDILQNTIVIRAGPLKTADTRFCLSAYSTSCASGNSGDVQRSGTTNTGVKSSSAIARCVTDLWQFRSKISVPPSGTASNCRHLAPASGQPVKNRRSRAP